MCCWRDHTQNKQHTTPTLLQAYHHMMQGLCTAVQRSRGAHAGLMGAWCQNIAMLIKLGSAPLLQSAATATLHHLTPALPL